MCVRLCLSHASQVLKSTKYVPPFSFEKQFGVYECNVRFNLLGGPEQAFLRHFLAVFDNNAFVTLWVSSILLEASQFPGGPAVSDLQLIYALEAISNYHDKNHALNDSITIFWPQTYNSSTGEWTAFPTNVGKLLDPALNVVDEIYKILFDLGLSHLAEEIQGYVENL